MPPHCQPSNYIRNAYKWCAVRRSQPISCRSWPAFYQNSSPHMQPYPHSQELFYLCLSFALPSSHSPFSPNHTCLFATLLIGIVLDLLLLVLFSIFGFPHFLSFLLAGSFGNSGFYSLFLILRISQFFPYSRNSRSGWFVWCLVSSILGARRLQNIRLACNRTESGMAGLTDNYLFSW